MRVLAGLVCSVALLFARPALAGDGDALIDEGVALRERGQDEQALDRFARAWAAAPSPRARAQMALAEQALGRWPLAEVHLTEALRSESDPWIGKNKAALAGALATVRSHLGDLIVDGAADGATVLVDGVAIATAPLSGPLRVEAGSHVLAVRKEGFFPVERTVRVASDAPAREQVHLVEQTSADPRPPPADPPAPPLTQQPLTPQPPPQAALQDTGATQRTVGWVLLASATPFLVTGLVGVAGRLSEVASYNGNTRCPGVDLPNQPAACQSLIDSANGWQAVTIVGFVGAGVLGVTGAIVELAAPRAPARSVACGPTLSGGACFGTF